MGDAVGHDVAGMYQALRDRGVETRIVAGAWARGVSLPVEPADRYGAYAARPDVLSIYHHSTSWELLPQFLEARGPKVVRYHNVTPPGFFARYSPQLARETRLGRGQTEMIVRSGRVALFLAASAYSARELVALGAPSASCRALAPFHTLADLLQVPASVPLLERYLDGTYNVLFVGRVTPNKGHRHLIGVAEAFRRLFARPIRLFVVGDLDPRFRAYHEELYALVRALGLEDTIVWTRKAGPESLKTYFLLAHAFLVMSEHEGFCVPIVEAMAHGTPVVAYASCAVSDTVGDAGVLIHGLDYGHYAAALELIFTRAQVRDAVIARQRRWVAHHFAAPVLATRFWDAIHPVLEARP